MTATPSALDAWRTALARPRFRVLAIAAPIVVTAVLLTFRRFLDVVEARPGAVIADPVLHLFAARDVATFVFLVMYAALVLGLVVLARAPERLVAGLWGYAAMIVLRMVTMHLLPLDPPPTLVPLRDPFVELFGDQHTLTRDLFFSGHTATIFLLALAMPDRRARAVVLAAALIVAVGVLAHHAHYTVDVVAAPFFAYACYRAGLRLVGVPR